MAKYILLVGGVDMDKRSGNPDITPVMFEVRVVEETRPAVV